VILPRLEPERFIAAIEHCDIVLGSIGWSGFNSTLEGLTYARPIVTMAGGLMRGRHTAAVLKMIGVTETATETVDDYVAAAVPLARDTAWRTAMRNKMETNKRRLYRDRACITAFKDFLDRTTRGHGRI
jgi:protein O-GlcNAc transferase